MSKPLGASAGIVALGFVGMILSGPTGAAPGFTYQVIALVPREDYSNGARICSFALNDLGQVAYGILRGSSTASRLEQIRLFDGISDQVVFEAVPTASESVDCDPVSNNSAPTVGLRADGLVSFSVDTPTGEQLAFGRPGTGIQGRIAVPLPGSGVLGLFGPGLNFANRMGFVRFNAAGAITFGTANSTGAQSTAIISPATSSSLGNGRPTINERNQVALLYRRQSSAGGVALHDPDAPLAADRLRTLDLPSSIAVGDLFSATPGLNSRGVISFAVRQSSTLGNPARVLVVDAVNSGGLITVADNTTSRFGDFTQLTSVNDFNQVAFASTATIASGLLSGIHLGDAARSEPLDVALAGDQFPFGALSLDYQGTNQALSPSSVNTSGQVLFSSRMTQIGAGGGTVEALVLATPAPGLLPGLPIVPGPGDVIPGPGNGWRLRGCRSGIPVGGRCIQVGFPAGPARARYYDPPVARGYTYTMDAGGPNFASVLIPVALPGGDADFTIEFSGQTAALRASETFDIAARIPGGVSTFRIVDIDLEEALDPDNARAFVTGLTFVDGPEQELSFTMIPIVENTDDPDGDGVIASRDNCPTVANANQADGDGDRVGDVCDNCPAVANPDQLDDNNNDIGNACEIEVVPPRVTGYELVSSVRFDRTRSDFTYRVRIQNAGTAYSSGTFTVTSGVAATQVIDGSVVTGAIAANAAVTPTDTFTIRQDRTVPFDASKLTWVFTGTVAPAP